MPRTLGGTRGARWLKLAQKQRHASRGGTGRHLVGMSSSRAVGARNRRVLGRGNTGFSSRKLNFRHSFRDSNKVTQTRLSSYSWTFLLDRPANVTSMFETPVQVIQQHTRLMQRGNARFIMPSARPELTTIPWVGQSAPPAPARRRRRRCGPNQPWRQPTRWSTTKPSPRIQGRVRSITGRFTRRRRRRW